jgi:hypothetical protein
MTEQEMARHLEIEKPRLPQYRNFCEAYGLEPFEVVVALYDVDELTAHLPPSPTEAQKAALQKLIGTTGVPGYMDYIKSNNTFELIMRWQESTQSFEDNAIFFTKDDDRPDRS